MNSKWYRCDYRLSDIAAQRLFAPESHSGRAFRKLVARLCDEQRLSLPPALFNYDEGRPIASLPAVRFLGYARGLSLIGLGDEGVKLAEGAAPVVHAALTKAANAIISVEQRSGAVLLRPTPMPVRYVAKSALLSPTAAVPKWLQWVDMAKEQGCTLAEVPQARDEMAALLEASLQRHMDWLDPVAAGSLRSQWNMLATQDDEDLMVARGDRPFTVRVISCGKHFLQGRQNHTALALQRNNPDLAVKGSLPLVGVKQIEFTVNAELLGIWQVGRLTSAGNGLVQQVRASAAHGGLLP